MGGTFGEFPDPGPQAPAFGTHERRKMIGPQIANSYWVQLEDYLGGELDPPVKTRFAEAVGTATVRKFPARDARTVALIVQT